MLAGFRAYFRFVAERTSGFQLLFGSGARQTDEFADAVRALEASVAATIGAFIDADIDESHRDLLGLRHRGSGRGHGAPVGQPAREATGGVLRSTRRKRRCWPCRLSDLVWAGLRGLPGRGPAVSDPKPRIPPSCDLTLGMTCVDKSRPGVTVWEMPAGEHLANPMGMVQGGFLAAFADSAMTTAAITNLQGRRAFAANTDLTISFLRVRRSAAG